MALRSLSGCQTGDGQRSGGLEPYAVAHRQIGGHPGPCYSHPAALQTRRDFLSATVEHFRGHPALSMWDVWNEPELSFPQRTPDIARMVCYCPHCRQGFLKWLRRKYGTMERLNQVWGRCYTVWEEVELPSNPATITDFVDWREFHIDTMTAEARWRLAMVRELDPDHVRYLHVVPNTMAAFNSVTCAADDFALAEECEVFAATMNGGPVMATQVVSAAHGTPPKLVYNVESHVNHGCTSLHQPILDLNALLLDFLPQIGLGIRGFLFWQYRPEVLGFESPGWGLVRLDGSDRPITKAAAAFWEVVKPHREVLLDCPAPDAEVGIWKSRKNEVFHHAIHRSFRPLIDSVEGYLRALYWQSVPTRIVSGQMLAEGDLEGLKLLVMPSPYYVTEAEAAQLDAWVRRGGVALVEAHLAGYNGTTGRHSRVLPGCGLAEAWGLRETETTAVRHLPVDATVEDSPAGLGDGGMALTEDVKKALAEAGVAGREVFPITPLADSRALAYSRAPAALQAVLERHDEAAEVLWGADRYAELGGDGLQVLGTFAGRPLLVAKHVGDGYVIYAGSRLGQGAVVAPAALLTFLGRVVALAGITPPMSAAVPSGVKVHVDLLRDAEGQPRFLVVVNRDAEQRTLHLGWVGEAHGLFTKTRWALVGKSQVTVPGFFIDLFELVSRVS
ncbi:beta-galactosidase [bacterium]|nr:beta-galactosidase [bacterium]